MSRARVEVDSGERSGGTMRFWTVDAEAAGRVIGAIKEAERSGRDDRIGWSVAESRSVREITFKSSSDEAFNAVLKVACRAAAEANRSKDSRRRDDRQSR